MEKIIVPSGEHPTQEKARNSFYKMMESWFYTIPAMKAFGRKETTKIAEKVCAVYLSEKS